MSKYLGETSLSELVSKTKDLVATKMTGSATTLYSGGLSGSQVIGFAEIQAITNYKFIMINYKVDGKWYSTIFASSTISSGVISDGSYRVNCLGYNDTYSNEAHISLNFTSNSYLSISNMHNHSCWLYIIGIK